MNQAQAVERKKIAMKYLDIVSKILRGPLRTTELGILRETFPAPVVARDDDNNGTIRFDMKFPMVTPIDAPREVWFDHMIVQETCCCDMEFSGRGKYEHGWRWSSFSESEGYERLALFGTDFCG